MAIAFPRSTVKTGTQSPWLPCRILSSRVSSVPYTCFSKSRITTWTRDSNGLKHNLRHCPKSLGVTIITMHCLSVEATLEGSENCHVADHITKSKNMRFVIVHPFHWEGKPLTRKWLDKHWTTCSTRFPIQFFTLPFLLLEAPPSKRWQTRLHSIQGQFWHPQTWGL